jgi:DNA repair protein RadD
MIAMLRHTMSGGLLVQMAGRGTRTINPPTQTTAPERKAAIAASTKPNCLFLDFSGNIQRHGFLDTITGKDKKKGVAPMKDCPECATIVYASAKNCPDCGYIFDARVCKECDARNPKDAEHCSGCGAVFEKIQAERKTVLTDAHDGAVLSSQVKLPERRKVTDVEYIPHNLSKDEKTPTLRVKYHHPDQKPTNEWICLQHEGYAKQKAHAWWMKMGGRPEEIRNLGIKMIIDGGYCNSLKKPSAIVVVPEGKYERIVHYDFSNPLPMRKEADNTLAECEDIDAF